MSRPDLIPWAAAVSWFGLLVHNVADLPDQVPWSPESAVPALVLIAFIIVRRFRRRLGSVLLIVWAALHLVGGAVLSVLPVQLWPFDPEQSVRHYAFHILYGLTQLPLLLVALRELGVSDPTRGVESPGAR